MLVLGRLELFRPAPQSELRIVKDQPPPCHPVWDKSCPTPKFVFLILLLILILISIIGRAFPDTARDSPFRAGRDCVRSTSRSAAAGLRHKPRSGQIIAPPLFVVT